MSRRILFVLAAGRRDAAPWIGHVSDLGCEAHVLATREARLPEGYRNLVAWEAAPADGDEARGLSHASCALPAGAERVDVLVEIVRRVRPEAIHSDGSLEAASLAHAARAPLGDAFPPWVLTLRERFAYRAFRIPAFEARARSLLEVCDACLCEREADAEALERLGYRGPHLPPVPLVEGFDLAFLDAIRAPGPPSARRLLRLDGGQDWSQRALTGLRALALSARFLRGYDVVVERAGDDVRTAAALVARSAGVEITAVDEAAPAEVLRRSAQARISIGLGLADAARAGLFESLATGALPLQSATSTAAEWIRDGESGLLASPEDPGVVALALQRALTDDALVDQAAERNARVVAARLERSRIRAAIGASYETLLGAPSVTGRRLRRSA